MNWELELRALLTRAARLKDALRNQLEPDGGSFGLPSVEALSFFDGVVRIFETAQSNAAPEELLSPLRRVVLGRDNTPEQQRRMIGSHPYKILDWLTVIEAELSDFLKSPEAEWVAKVELAFLHLNRLLVVDEDLRHRWEAAWRDQREPALERLGGVHLLSHGLCGFKARGDGGETDLVLGERVSVQESERAASPLVLTEWKKTDPSPDAVAAKTSEACSQLSTYPASIIGALALRRTRYVILVSQVTLPAWETNRTLSDGATARVVNVAIRRETPSKLAARVARRTRSPR